MATKFSRQREAIWNYLKDRKDHPTAESVYLAVRQDCTNISLGTVYRNLMLLKDTGMIRTVDVGDGVIHFDPNTSEHDHFICVNCGRVIDIEGGDTEAIKAEAAKNFAGRIQGYSAYFSGLCPDCAREEARKVSGDENN